MPVPLAQDHFAPILSSLSTLLGTLSKSICKGLDPESWLHAVVFNKNKGTKGVGEEERKREGEKQGGAKEADHQMIRKRVLKLNPNGLH